MAATAVLAFVIMCLLRDKHRLSSSKTVLAHPSSHLCLPICGGSSRLGVRYFRKAPLWAGMLRDSGGLLLGGKLELPNGHPEANHYRH